MELYCPACWAHDCRCPYASCATSFPSEGSTPVSALNTFHKHASASVTPTADPLLRSLPGYAAATQSAPSGLWEQREEREVEPFAACAAATCISLSSRILLQISYRGRERERFRLKKVRTELGWLAGKRDILVLLLLILNTIMTACGRLSTPVPLS